MIKQLILKVYQNRIGQKLLYVPKNSNFKAGDMVAILPVDIKIAEPSQYEASK